MLFIEKNGVHINVQSVNLFPVPANEVFCSLPVVVKYTDRLQLYDLQQTLSVGLSLTDIQAKSAFLQCQEVC